MPSRRVWGMANPPTNETGHPGGVKHTFSPHGGGSRFEVDPLERTWELQFPRSIAVFDRMRSEEAHIGGVLRAITMPVVKAAWSLDDTDVRPEVAGFVRSELGLPAPGEARARRRRQGVSWTEHVKQSCHQLWAGFMPFEQVYEIGPARPGQQDLDGDVIHLRKLAPRLPRTIRHIETGPDGGLKAVYQDSLTGGSMKPIRIGVDRLVMYTHQMEGADWSGRSTLRQAYKNWLIKDVLLRLDAQAAERNSMGIPTISYLEDKPGHKEHAENIVRGLRAGEQAGAALPDGMTLSIKGVEGSTTNLLDRMKYHDQEMARAQLAMFLDLGHDRGAQSLGDTFLDVFMDSVQEFADSISETATEHIIRDLVELNFGPDEPYPTLTPGDMKKSRGVSVEALKTLVDSGVVRPDDKLEEFMRSQYGLPDRDTESVRVPSEAAANAETAGTLVRAGYDPSAAAAAAAAGLEHMPHLGLPPVTVQPPRQEPSQVQASQPALSGLDDLLLDLIEDHRRGRA